IDFKLRGLEPPKPLTDKVIKADKLRLDYYAKAERLETGTLPVEERLANMVAEVNQSLSYDQALEEAKREALEAFVAHRRGEIRAGKPRTEWLR
ncbi:MAG: hypothetical protein ACE5FI_18955, partial [Anaerolineales bacterium]